MAAVEATTAQASELKVGTRSFGSGWLALLAVYVFWGSTYPAIRLGDQTFPPLLLTGTFYVTAGLVLYPFVRRSSGSTDRSVQWLHWRSALIVGGSMLLGANGLLSIAEVTLPAGIAAVTAATAVLWLVIFDAAMLRTMPRAMTIVGLGLGLAGIVILAKPGSVQPAELFAIALILLGGIFWAAGSLYSRRASHPASPFLESAQQMLAGGTLCLLAGVLTGEAGALHPTWSTVAAIAWLAIPGSVIGFTSYIYALKLLPASTVATYAFANPIVAVIAGTLLLHEAMTGRTLLAMVVILAGVALILRTRRTPAP